MDVDERTMAVLRRYADLDHISQYMVMRRLGVPVLFPEFQSVTQLAACFRWLYVNNRMEQFKQSME